MRKIKKGDKVIVIAGKCKGETGNVLAVLDDGKKVLLEGINLVKKTVKANPQAGVRGGIEEKAMPMDRSNVMLVTETGERSRISIKTLEDGQKVRVFKVSEQLVEVAK